MERLLLQKRVGPLALALVLFLAAVATPARGAQTLNGHTVVQDGSGKLLSWVSPQGEAYDQVMGRAWDFLLNRVPTGSNGLKLYYSYSYLDPNTLAPADWPHN